MTATLAAGCLTDLTSGGGGDGNGSGDGSPIVISALEPLSGPFSVYGPRHRAGAEFAAKQINDEGGVRDRQIRIRTVDTASNAQDAVSAFTEAVEQNDAVAGIGPGASEVGIRVGDVAEQKEVPLYLHAAGAVAVVPKEARYTFRTALPATPTVGRAQAQLVEDRGYTEIGLIYEDGVWGDEYGAAVEEYFPDDINITSDSAPIPQTDFVPQLRNFPDDIEVFLGTAHPAGVSSLYPQMYEIGLEPDLFLGAITPMEADYNAMGDNIGQSFASFNLTDMYSDKYAEQASAFNEDSEFGGLFDHAQVAGYTAVQLVAQSIEEAGSTDPTDIAEATRTGSFDLLYASPLEYTEWGEPKNTVQIYNGFDVESSPEFWSDGAFAPVEEFRTDPLPAFEPGSLDLN
ncbi:ABC transporter substrate-binding protein [Halomarina salina]|uniref:ABC transporter substrate-binding protein n=1 Tax=Halomarina salina TaxID=1872699 RepID=A0ABD5RSZ9_9EURY